MGRSVLGLNGVKVSCRGREESLRKVFFLSCLGVVRHFLFDELAECDADCFQATSERSTFEFGRTG
jgi:hypothetical protein